MYIVLDNRDQIWGYLTSKDDAIKFCEENGGTNIRLHYVWVDKLEL